MSTKLHCVAITEIPNGRMAELVDASGQVQQMVFMRPGEGEFIVVGMDYPSGSLLKNPSSD